MRKEVKASKKYWFVVGEELNNKCAFDAFLFNDPAHLVLQPSKNRYSYYLIKKHDEVIHARCTFFIEQGVAYSPFKGSFGSIEFSDKVFFEMLEEFWDNIEVDLKINGAKEIFIKNYPVCYNPSHAQMLSFLFSTKGFQIKTQELNFHIEVDEEEFEKKLHENELRKLKLADRLGFRVKREKKIDIDLFYSLYKHSREEKKIPITMDKQSLEKTLKKFPLNHLLFTCYFQNNLSACCLCILINDKLIYTFYLVDNSNFKKYSLLVLIHKQIYEFARESRIKVLDLGIGSEGGIGSKGLIRFKEKIGGASGIKTTFTKPLLIKNSI